MRAYEENEILRIRREQERLRRDHEPTCCEALAREAMRLFAEAVRTAVAPQSEGGAR